MLRNCRNYLFLLNFLKLLGWRAAAAQTASPQFAPVPPPAPGRSSAPVKDIPGPVLLAELKRGGVLTGKPLARYDGLRALFDNGPGKARNTIIVSHGNPFYATAGAPYLAEGEAAIIKPLGNDFEVIARVRWDGWSGLAP